MRKIFIVLLILILLTSTSACSSCSSYCSHNYLGETLVYPTCEMVGSRKYTCEVCEDSYQTVLDELWHTSGEDNKCIRCERLLVTKLNVSLTADTKAYVINSATYDYTLNVELIFESEKDGFTYREIGESAFMHSVFRKVSLPPTIKKINKDAFKENLNLFYVNLNRGMEVIEDGAFSGCTTLSEITIYPSLLYIGKDVFKGCVYLDKINFIGTKEQFDKIVVDSGNEKFLSATVEFVNT